MMIRVYHGGITTTVINFVIERIHSPRVQYKKNENNLLTEQTYIHRESFLRQYIKILAIKRKLKRLAARLLK